MKRPFLFYCHNLVQVRPTSGRACKGLGCNPWAPASHHPLQCSAATVSGVSRLPLSGLAATCCLHPRSMTVWWVMWEAEGEYRVRQAKEWAPACGIMLMWCIGKRGAHEGVSSLGGKWELCSYACSLQQRERIMLAHLHVECRGGNCSHTSMWYSRGQEGRGCPCRCLMQHGGWGVVSLQPCGLDRWPWLSTWCFCVH